MSVKVLSPSRAANSNPDTGVAFSFPIQFEAELDVKNSRVVNFLFQTSAQRTNFLTLVEKTAALGKCAIFFRGDLGCVQQYTRLNNDRLVECFLHNGGDQAGLKQRVLDILKAEKLAKN